MNLKTIFLIITLFVCIAFSAPNVNLVSPYVMRGFSKTYSVSFHPEKFTGYYDIKAKPYATGRVTEGIDTIKSFMFMETERFNLIGIKEKAEIGFSLFGIPALLAVRARFRTAFNVYQKGDNELFSNIAITPFCGVSFNTEIPNILVSSNISFLKDDGLDYSYISHYYGTSIGTRKLVKDKYSFELFASPEYSFTNYFTDEIFAYNTSGYISFLVQSVDIPIGFRYVNEKRTVKFSIKSGIGLHFIINQLRNVSDYDHYSLFADITSTYSFKSSYFSAFAEIGFHFGSKKYNQERRRQLNLEKEVVS